MATVTNLPDLLATIGDPDGTRTVTSIIALLVAVGLTLVMIAVWLYRTTRPDPELLAPLEMMGERRWRRADPVAQRRTLDAARPRGAEPLTPSAAPPEVDSAFDAGPAAGGFEDLSAEPDATADEDHPAASTAGLPSEPQTPRQIERPAFDDFDRAEIDPDLLAAAAAELDAELERPPETP